VILFTGLNHGTMLDVGFVTLEIKTMEKFIRKSLQQGIDEARDNLSYLDSTVQVFHHPEFVTAAKYTLSPRTISDLEIYSHGVILKINGRVALVEETLQHFSRLVAATPDDAAGLPNMSGFPSAAPTIWPAVIAVLRMAKDPNTPSAMGWCGPTYMEWTPAAGEYLTRLETHLYDYMTPIEPEEITPAEALHSVHDYREVKMPPSAQKAMYFTREFVPPTYNEESGAPWSLLPPAEKLKRLHEYGGPLDAEAVRDQGVSVPLWFKDGKTFQEQFNEPGEIKLASLIKYLKRGEKAIIDAHMDRTAPAAVVTESEVPQRSARVKRSPKPTRAKEAEHLIEYFTEQITNGEVYEGGAPDIVQMLEHFGLNYPDCEGDLQEVLQRLERERNQTVDM
jgi:hypothetical protein